ncbi:MAG: CAP domain-containing protein [Candidatus Levyibacteriota bacterium]
MQVPEIQTLFILLGKLPFNIFDAVICLCLIAYLFEEYIGGGKQAVSNLLSLIVSFFLGLTTYTFLSDLLAQMFHASKGFSDATAFFALSIPYYFLFNKLSSIIINSAKLPANNAGSKIVAVVAGALSFFFISAFVVSIFLSFPISAFFKSEMRSSVFGKILYTRTQIIESSVKQVFGATINETINFLTVPQETNTSVPLNFQTGNVTVDQDSENKMLALVNAARQKQGVGPLVPNAALLKLARAYGIKMLAEGYFSHFTPEGLSPFDRLSQTGIPYTAAGENLAFAPDVDLAFAGLMKSEGHRKNILDPQFHLVGIGVIDAGPYGKMFIQEFTD